MADTPETKRLLDKLYGPVPRDGNALNPYIVKEYPRPRPWWAGKKA